MSDSELDYYAVQGEWLDFKRQYVGRSLFWFHVRIIILKCACLGLVVSLLAIGVILLRVLEAPIDARTIWGFGSTLALCLLFCIVRQLGMAEAREVRLLAVAREAFLGQHEKYRAVSWVRDMVHRRYLT